MELGASRDFVCSVFVEENTRGRVRVSLEFYLSGVQLTNGHISKHAGCKCSQLTHTTRNLVVDSRNKFDDISSWLKNVDDTEKCDNFVFQSQRLSE